MTGLVVYQKTLVIQQQELGLTILQQNNLLQFNAPTLQGPAGIGALTPFYFNASAGQSIFVLASVPALGIILLAINGVAQSQAGGDYTLIGKTITLSQGVDLDDEVFGVYA